MSKKIKFIKILFYIGAIVDVIAAIPLIFPELAQSNFGIESYQVTNDYLYTSKMSAALMLGWAFLLFWGASKPVERKALFPVVFGMIISSILVVTSGL